MMEGKRQECGEVTLRQWQRITLISCFHEQNWFYGFVCTGSYVTPSFAFVKSRYGFSASPASLPDTAWYVWSDSATRLLINRCHGKHAKMKRFTKFKMHVFFKIQIFKWTKWQIASFTQNRADWLQGRKGVKQVKGMRHINESHTLKNERQRQWWSPILWHLWNNTL